MAKEGEEDWGTPEYGVRSSDIGSFIPEGTYRAVPIVWLAGAWFMQVIALGFVFTMLVGISAPLTALAAGLVTWWIAHRTWRRGMARAAAGWRIVTGIALGFNFALVALGAFAAHQ